MAGAFWGIRPPDEQLQEDDPRPVHREAHERLARAVEAKLAEGFEIESQDDKHAVLVKAPRKYLGVTMPGPAIRAVVSIDDRGHPTVRVA